MTTRTFFFILVALATNVRDVLGRRWDSVIEHGIYLQSYMDENRFLYQMEMDPFFTIGEEAYEPPQDQNADQDTPGYLTLTLTPTNQPSSFLSDSPSVAPATAETEDVSCEGGSILHEVNMYDSWGDGWAATTLRIVGFEDEQPVDVSQQSITTLHTTNNGHSSVTLSQTIELSSHQASNPAIPNTQVHPLGQVFEGSLIRGAHSSANVCLVHGRCYRVTIGGGDALNEVSWDIRQEDDSVGQLTEPIVMGGAPVECQFALPTEANSTFCPTACSDTEGSDATDPPRLVDNMTPVEEHVVATRAAPHMNGVDNHDAAHVNGQHLLHYLHYGN